MRLAKRKTKKQKGRGLGQSKPEIRPSLIDAILLDADDEARFSAIQEAIDRGANPNEKEDGMTPLIFLIKETNLNGESYMFYDDFIPIIIGENVNYMGPDGSALHYCGINGQEEYAVKLLQNGANINLQNVRGETPLFLASIHSNWYMIETLMSRGADPNIPDDQGRLPLTVAGLNDNDLDSRRRTIEALCNGGADGRQCVELQELRRREQNNFQRQMNMMQGQINILRPPPILTLDVPNQGPKDIQDKMQNMISFDDFINGEEIIVITEGTHEFIYKLSSLQQWFATKNAEGNAIPNPATGLKIQNQNQISRWTARIIQGGRKYKKKTSKKSLKKSLKKRR